MFLSGALIAAAIHRQRVNAGLCGECGHQPHPGKACSGQSVVTVAAEELATMFDAMVKEEPRPRRGHRGASVRSDRCRSTGAAR